MFLIDNGFTHMCINIYIYIYIERDDVEAISIC
jgi:hypothetical protein